MRGNAARTSLPLCSAIFFFSSSFQILMRSCSLWTHSLSASRSRMTASCFRRTWSSSARRIFDLASASRTWASTMTRWFSAASKSAISANLSTRTRLLCTAFADAMASRGCCEGDAARGAQSAERRGGQGWVWRADVTHSCAGKKKTGGAKQPNKGSWGAAAGEGGGARREGEGRKIGRKQGERNGVRFFSGFIKFTII